MVQQQSYLKIADNTGAKELMCIRVLGGTGRRYAGVGDIIVAAVKKAAPGDRSKKAEVVKCVVVRTVQESNVPRTTVKFDITQQYHSATAADEKNPKGTRILGR